MMLCLFGEDDVVIYFAKEKYGDFVFDAYRFDELEKPNPQSEKIITNITRNRPFHITANGTVKAFKKDIENQFDNDVEQAIRVIGLEINI
jgi:hypothetical protein